MIARKIIITASTVVFCGTLLTACGGDDKADSKAAVATTEAVVAKVVEKKVEKKAAPEKKPMEEAAKKPTAEDAAKMAEAKEREKQTIRTTIDSAKNAMSNAAQAGFEWTIWKKMIAKAESAFEKGNMDKAAKLSYKIIHQSAAALKQSVAAESAGPRF